MAEDVIRYSELTMTMNEHAPFRCSCAYADSEFEICDYCAIAFAAEYASDAMPELRRIRPGVEFNLSQAMRELFVEFNDKWTDKSLSLHEWLESCVRICTWNCESCGENVEFENNTFTHYSNSKCGAWSVNPIYVSL